MQPEFVCFVLHCLILFLELVHAMLHSPTHSDLSAEFDWKSFLDIPEDSNVTPSLEEHNSIGAQHSRKERKDKGVPRKNKKEQKLPRKRERRKDLQKIYHKTSKIKFQNLPESEKAKVRELRNERQRRHGERLKKLTGFSSRREERIAQARTAKELGTLTEEQEQLLQRESDRKRKYNEKRKYKKIPSTSKKNDERRVGEKKNKEHSSDYPSHPEDKRQRIL